MQVLSLSDELEIQKHASSKVTSLQKSLDSYKEKLQLHDALKSKLEEEQDAHTKAIEKVIKLENINSSIAPLKKQCESYRKRSSDFEVKLEVKEKEIERLDKELKVYQRQKEMLQASTDVQFREAEELQRLLVESYTGGEFSEGEGSGIGELNPKVVEEMLRLKNENERLEKLAEECSEESVAKIRDELEDAKLKGESFKDKFMASDSSLTAANASLKSAKETISVSKKSIASLNEKLQNLELEMKSERTKQEAKLSSTLSDLDTALAEKAELQELASLRLTKFDAKVEEFEEYKRTHSLQDTDVFRKKESMDHQMKLERGKVEALEESMIDLGAKYDKVVRERSNLQEDVDALKRRGAEGNGGEMEVQYEARKCESVRVWLSCSTST